MKKICVFRTIACLLLVLHMVIIFGLSNQNAEESSGTSGRIIRAVVGFVIPDFDEMQPEKQNEIVASLQFIVRKSAHFVSYSILGVLSFLNVATINKLSLLHKFLISLGFSIIYSITDEIHQLYIPGRSGEIRDVCIDSLGALTGIALCILIYLIILKIQNRKTLQ